MVCFDNSFILVKMVSMYNDVCTRQISLMMKIIIIICFTFIFEKDQNLNFFISLASKCVLDATPVSLVRSGVVKWKQHWQDFPFSCPSLLICLNWNLENHVTIFFLFFHAVAIIENLGNNLWKCFHYNLLWWKKIAKKKKKRFEKKELTKWRFLIWSEIGETNGLLFIPSTVLYLIITYTQCEILSKWEKNKIVTIFLSIYFLSHLDFDFSLVAF